ncbi:MAG: CpsB/CapC family capsule biosynthesis tyrosine phosphatase [Deltaproteobacteria bacterium]
MIDLHCHILPGIDDGPTDIGESLDMARQAVLDGIHTVVATPHSQNGVYVNSNDDICRQVREINRMLQDAGVPLVVLSGAEEHIRPDMGHAGKSYDISTINNIGRYVLVEFPFMTVPHGAREMLYRMKQRGLTPVLAHPERNAVIQRNIEILYPFVESGCLTQITAMSLTGDMGEPAKSCACRMVELRLAHVIASDAHSSGNRRPELSPAVALAADILGSRQEAENMVLHTPQAIISGQAVHFQDPIKPLKKKRWFFGK